MSTLDAIDLDTIGSIEPQLFALIPESVARRWRCLPIERADGALVVAVASPVPIGALSDLEFLTGYDVRFRVASASDIDAAIEVYYGSP